MRKIIGAIAGVSLGSLLVAMNFYTISCEGVWSNDFAEFIRDPALIFILGFCFWNFLDWTFGE